MPRVARARPGGLVYHVLTRGNERRAIFHKAGDAKAFINLIWEAKRRVPEADKGSFLIELVFLVGAGYIEFMPRIARVSAGGVIYHGEKKRGRTSNPRDGFARVRAAAVGCGPCPAARGTPPAVTSTTP